MIGARANAHSAEIEAMPGARAFQQAEEDAAYAREQESERVYEDTLEELMSGNGETSYPLEIITDDTKDGGLWHQLMAACEQSLTDEAEAGRQLKAIYKAGCERYAERRAEDV